MLNANKLKGIIVERGMTQKEVAAALGIQDKAFRARIRKGVFNSTQIEIMIDLLKIEDPCSVFFAKNVT